MSDFFQNGVVSTLHRLTPGGLERLEEDLRRFSLANPIGLVLPALYREFEHPAMRGIVDELRHVDYIRRIVVAIGECTEEQFREAASFFDGFHSDVVPIWMEDPRLEELFGLFNLNDVPAGPPGKGRTCWLAYGYLLACDDCEVIALHDCDIRNYSREIVARLVYPIVHPNLGFEFAKGYYARISDRMHGRVTRLFFSPLVQAIQNLTPEIPYLRFLDSFRYALAGEFAMRADLARLTRIPSDWGLEVGVLAEVYRNLAVSRVCQVDLTDNYEHKHQPLSEGDATKGLRRMTFDIALSLFRTIAQEGHVFGSDHFRTLVVYYQRLAQDAIRRYHADATLNGLICDRHEEGMAVQIFAKSLREAGAAFLEDPMGAPQIPNWNRVASAIPDIYERLRALEARQDSTAEFQAAGPRPGVNTA